MCEPTTAIMAVGLVVSAVGTYAGFKAQEQQARQQQQAQQEAYNAQRKANIEAAKQNAQLQNDAASAQIEGEREAAAQASVQVQTQKRQAAGDALTNAAAAGVRGLSIDQTMLGLYSDEEAAQSNIQANLKRNLSNIEANQISTELARTNAIDAPRTTVGYTGPNGSAAAFQFGGYALGKGADIYKTGYDKGLWGQNKTPAKKEG